MSSKDDSQKGDINTDEEMEATTEETSAEEKDTPLKKKMPLAADGSEDEDEDSPSLADEDDSDDEDGDTSAYEECDKGGCKEEIY